MIKDYKPENIRNVAIIGHASSGKTTLMEALLYCGGSIKEMGSVDKGNTIGDFDEEEINRKISIRTSVGYFEMEDTKVNLIDVPGLSDFIAEAICALRVADCAIIVIDAESGVQIQSEKMWELCQEYDIPVMVFVNKMDKEHADFNKAVESVKEKFGKTTAILQLPIGKFTDFKGVVDLIGMKALFPSDNGRKLEVKDIPDDLKDEASSANEAMLEAIAEAKDELIEKFLEGEEISREEVNEALQIGLNQSTFIPVFVGNALTNNGVKPLVDFIVKTAPPANRTKEMEVMNSNKPEETHKISPDPSAPFTAFVFKTMVDQYAGRVSFLRVRSGTLKANEEICNPRTDTVEKISHIYAVNGKNKVEQDIAVAGDIVALTKLTDAITDDSITSPSKRVIFEKLKIPPPISFTAIKAKNRNDNEKLLETLFKYQEEDASFSLKFNKETKQNVIESMGELQTDIALGRVKAKYPNMEIIKEVPKVAYRETVKKTSNAKYRHKKQTGGHGQFGEVVIELSPLPRNGGFEFQDAIVGGVIPKNFIPGVEKGLHEALESGVLAGFPVCDIKVKLYDGSFHAVDSSEMAFKIAARSALKAAMEQADPVLLEPIMNVKIYVDEQYMGNVMNDINGRRGKILGMEKVHGGTQLVQAMVPLSEMLRYSIDLKTITSGQGTFEMTFDHYEEISGRLADKVISDAKAAKEEED